MICKTLFTLNFLLHLQPWNKVIQMFLFDMNLVCMAWRVLSVTSVSMTWRVAVSHNTFRVRLRLRPQMNRFPDQIPIEHCLKPACPSMSDVELRVPWETGIMKQLLDRDGEIIFQIIVPAVPPDHLMPFATSGAESSEPLGMSGRPHSWEPGTCGSVHAVVFFCNQSCA